MAQALGCMNGYEATPLRNDNFVTSKADYVTVKVKSDESDRDEEGCFQPASGCHQGDPIEPSCKNQHLSHARDLLSYYRSHVQGIENLIGHHDDVERKYVESDRSHKALVCKFDKTENELTMTKTELDQTNGKLASTRKELEYTKVSLSKTKTELEQSIVKLTSTCKELESTKHLLSETTRDLNVTKEALSKTTADVKRTMETLSSTEKKLDAAQKDLTMTQKTAAKTQAELKDTKADLNKTNDRLESTALKLDQTNTILNHTKTALTSTKDTLKSTEDKLAATKTEFARLRETHEADTKDLEGKIDEANKGEEKARLDSTALESKKDVLEKEIRRLNRASSAAFLKGEGRMRGDFYLDHVVYGGKDITNKEVLNVLLEHAVNGTPFTISNKLMGGDPWKGETKSFTAVYAVGGKAPFKYLNKKEYEEAKFV